MDWLFSFHHKWWINSSLFWAEFTFSKTFPEVAHWRKVSTIGGASPFQASKHVGTFEEGHETLKKTSTRNPSKAFIPSPWVHLVYICQMKCFNSLRKITFSIFKIYHFCLSFSSASSLKRELDKFQIALKYILSVFPFNQTHMPTFSIFYAHGSIDLASSSIFHCSWL